MPVFLEDLKSVMCCRVKREIAISEKGRFSQGHTRVLGSNLMSIKVQYHESIKISRMLSSCKERTCTGWKDTARSR